MTASNRRRESDAWSDVVIPILGLLAFAAFVWMICLGGIGLR